MHWWATGTNRTGKEFFYCEDHYASYRYASFRKAIWIPMADCEKDAPGY